jgi:hypothetical protein
MLQIRIRCLFLYQFKTKLIFNFLILALQKNVGQKFFLPSLLLLLLDLGSLVDKIS